MTKNNFRLTWMLVLAGLLVICGCAHYTVNKALDTCSAVKGYSFENLSSTEDADEIFIVLTFSGGGTRAAALSYGVLEKLRDTVIPGTTKSILDEVDIISTVSGGSFTGAYYALFGNRIFAEFKDKFLYRSIEKELMVKLINPFNWFRLASPYYSRIDLAAELYDKTIFDQKIFRALAAANKRPFLIMNATNLYQGARFEFTSDQFRYLGSDLLSYPVAKGVASSSAFPFLLSPITLKNYPCKEGSKLDGEDQSALEDYWINKRRYYATWNNAIYKNVEDHEFMHLMDGGLADNLGLRAVYDLYVRSSIRQKINDGNIKRFLVIVVNAKTTSPQQVDKRESPPGLITVGYKTCTLSMDNYTFETVEMFKELLSKRIKDQKVLYVCQAKLDEHATDGFKLPRLAGAGLKLYVADLEFNNLSDEKERDYFNNLPTSFTLEKSEVKALIKVGGQLLVENPGFNSFLKDFSN